MLASFALSLVCLHELNRGECFLRGTKVVEPQRGAEIETRKRSLNKIIFKLSKVLIEIWNSLLIFQQLICVSVHEAKWFIEMWILRMINKTPVTDTFTLHGIMKPDAISKFLSFYLYQISWVDERVAEKHKHLSLPDSSCVHEKSLSEPHFVKGECDIEMTNHEHSWNTQNLLIWDMSQCESLPDTWQNSAWNSSKQKSFSVSAFSNVIQLFHNLTDVSASTNWPHCNKKILNKSKLLSFRHNFLCSNCTRSLRLRVHYHRKLISRPFLPTFPVARIKSNSARLLPSRRNHLLTVRHFLESSLDCSQEKLWRLKQHSRCNQYQFQASNSVLENIKRQNEIFPEDEKYYFQQHHQFHFKLDFSPFAFLARLRIEERKHPKTEITVEIYLQICASRD